MYGMLWKYYNELDIVILFKQLDPWDLVKGCAHILSYPLWIYLRSHHVFFTHCYKNREYKKNKITKPLLSWSLHSQSVFYLPVSFFIFLCLGHIYHLPKFLAHSNK